MTGVESILARCRELGVILIPTENGTLKVRAPRRPPEDLLQALRQHKREVLLVLEPINELPASSALTDAERLADLDAEEALFRTYWRTLPDKALGRRTWPTEVRWYCGQKGLEAEVVTELEQRCKDLLDEEDLG